MLKTKSSCERSIHYLLGLLRRLLEDEEARQTLPVVRNVFRTYCICSFSAESVLIGLLHEGQIQLYESSRKPKTTALRGNTRLCLLPPPSQREKGFFRNTGHKPALDRAVVFAYAITMGKGFGQISLLWHLFMVAYSNKADER